MKQSFSMNETSRDRVLDIARGFCIIFMIMSHVSGWSQGKYSQIPKYTGIFFLVFFFFCSGIFFRDPDNKPEYIRRILVKLERPYVVVCTLVLIRRYYYGVRDLHTLVCSFFYALPAGFSAPYLFIGQSTVGIGPIWFMNCLFVSICMYLMLPKLDNVLKTAAVIILAGMTSITQKYVVLPFNIQDGVIGMMFLHFGVLMAPYVKRIILWSKNHLWRAIVLISVLLLLFYIDINYVPFQWLDLGSNKYNIQSLIGAFLGFLLLLLCSAILEGGPYISDLLAFVGQYSMAFLIIHAVDIDILRDWAKINNLFIAATFVIYLGSVYMYISLKQIIRQKRSEEKQRIMMRS